MTSHHNSLVSTIIPVYNRPLLLREAVLSVVSQSYRPIEIIIVDDGSNDQTPHQIERLLREYPNIIRIITQENRGPGPARQAGLDIALGEFIQFLDSDDLLLPRKFEFQVNALLRHPECALSYGKTREYILGQAVSDVPSRMTGIKLTKIFPSCLKTRIWATNTPLFRKRILDEIGPWSPLRVLEDWEFDCRLGSKEILLHYCDDFICDVRHHFSENRACYAWLRNIDAYRDMLKVYKMVYDYAKIAKVPEDCNEMRFFARNVFRLSRYAACEGLENEARELFALARQASGYKRGDGFDFKIYKILSDLIGWSAVGKLSRIYDKLRV